MRCIALALLTALPTLLPAQRQTQSEKYQKRDTVIVVDGDTVNTKLLNEVTFFMPLKLRKHSDREKYLYLKRKVYRVFKYAKIASDTLLNLEQELGELKSRRQKRRAIRRLQRYMNHTFADRLKRLSRTDGQILVKLVYRQTHLTPYQIIRRYRSGWTAFWWNLKANLFDISLKKVYDPKHNRQDRFIEDIIQEGLLSGQLKG